MLVQIYEISSPEEDGGESARRFFRTAMDWRIGTVFGSQQNSWAEIVLPPQAQNLRIRELATNAAPRGVVKNTENHSTGKGRPCRLARTLAPKF